MYVLDIQVVKISRLSFCLLHSTDKYFYKFMQLHLYSLHCIERSNRKDQNNSAVT